MEAKEQSRLAFSTPAAVHAEPELRDVSRVTSFLVPSAATMLLFVGTLTLFALNQHPIPHIHHPSVPVADIRAVVPLLAALATVFAVVRPRPALIAILALTPVWNSAIVAMVAGPIQIIPQTVFAGALITGFVLESAARRRLEARATYSLWSDAEVAPEPVPANRRPFTGLNAFRVLEAAAVAFVLLAAASTLNSSDPANSLNVLLHGILEPVAFGAIVVWSRPSPRGLLALAGALALSIAFASLIDLLQNLSAYGPNLTQIVNHRLDFTQTTYNNVGLFGVIIATAMPMLAAALLLRRQLRLPRWLFVALLVSAPISAAGLFFTVSKSAWLASVGALVLLLLLLMHTWWKRVGMSVAVVLVSAIFVPWPALVLQSMPTMDTAYRQAVVAMVGQSRFDSWNPTTVAGHGSMAERYYAVEGGIHMALDHPVLGVGLDEFHTYYIELGYRPIPATNDLDHAHSVFPEVAAELGFPALAMLLTMFAAALWSMWRVYRAAHDKVSRTLAATLLASITAWIVAATAYGADIYRAFRGQASDIVVLAVALGMSVALARWAREYTGASGERTRRAQRGGAPVFVPAFVPVSASPDGLPERLRPVR